MKKSVVLAVFGLAVGVVASYGQGTIHFDSYNALGGSGILTHFSGSLGSGLVGAGYTAGLIYSLSPIVDSGGNGDLNGGFTISSNTTSAFLTGGAAGYYAGPDFVLPSYSGSGSVYFEIIAYQTGIGYANSLLGRGHSDVFSYPLATGITQAVYPTFTPFTVSPVPEPTTLALAGLGGLGLLLFRRKQS